MKKFISVLFLSISLAGCSNYVVHPGALNTFESKTYDAINDANNLIEYARPKLANGQLPASMKPAFNKLIEAYNNAYPALQAYDVAIRNGQPSDQLLNRLTAFRTALNAALIGFKEAK